MATRKRIEDLGVLSVALHDICDQVKELEFLIKALKPSADLKDLNALEEMIGDISSNVADAWYTARFGDDEDESDPIFEGE